MLCWPKVQKKGKKGGKNSQRQQQQPQLQHAQLQREDDKKGCLKKVYEIAGKIFGACIPAKNKKKKPPPTTTQLTPRKTPKSQSGPNPAVTPSKRKQVKSPASHASPQQPSPSADLPEASSSGITNQALEEELQELHAEHSDIEGEAVPSTQLAATAQANDVRPVFSTQRILAAKKGRLAYAVDFHRCKVPAVQALMPKIITTLFFVTGCMAALCWRLFHGCVLRYG